MYNIQLNIPEDSQLGHLIASLAAEKHITPSQAFERIVNLGAPITRSITEETPNALVERLRAQKALRGGGHKAPSGKGIPEALIGMCAGNREFSNAIDRIIEGRAERYDFNG